MRASNEFTAYRGRGGLVAGFDGSEHGQQAIRWAAAEASARERPLLLVHAHLAGVTTAWGTVAAPGWGATNATFEDAYIQREIQAHLDETARECRTQAPEVATVLAKGESSPALINAASTANAELVVVGRSSLGRLLRILFGSTALDIVRRSDRPVVVVHDSHPATDAPVVLGVDGTDTSLPAVRFAFEHAARHGCGLRAVHTISGSDQIICAAEASREEFLGAWRHRYPSVPVEIDIVEERPVPALLRRATGARLLVVGSSRTNGRNPFGSVSRATIHRAPCPVAVVPRARLLGAPRHMPAPRKR